jgi:hypothetical protein
VLLWVGLQHDNYDRLLQSCSVVFTSLWPGRFAQDVEYGFGIFTKVGLDNTFLAQSSKQGTRSRAHISISSTKYYRKKGKDYSNKFNFMVTNLQIQKTSVKWAVLLYLVASCSIHHAPLFALFIEHIQDVLLQSSPYVHFAMNTSSTVAYALGLPLSSAAEDALSRLLFCLKSSFSCGKFSMAL